MQYISQLLTRRLQRFLDEQYLRQVMLLQGTQNDVDVPAPPSPPNQASPPQSNTRPHLPPPRWANPIANVKSVIIHETTGWTSYDSARNFVKLYHSLGLHYWWNAHYNRWSDNRGVGPQFYIDGNGTVFSLLGQENLVGAPLMTYHAESMNPISLGIENGDTGDGGTGVGQGLGDNLWWKLSNQPDDLTGMKVYFILHPADAPDLILVWYAQFPQQYTNNHWGARPGAGAPFGGSGDIDDGANPATDRKLTRHPQWKNMLFTERDYRSLALLSRCLSEYADIPRNFLLFPYLKGDVDSANNTYLRKILLSDQLCDQIAPKLSTTTAQIKANGITASQAVWNQYLGIGNNVCYKGFLSHAINGDHDCPGPLFDWHRFSREIWDWWWYPFDFIAPVPTLSTTRRPYRQARLTTPLVEYYWDAIGAAADYTNLLVTPSVTASPSVEMFKVPGNTPIYAVANGVIIAARIPSSILTNPGQGFVLVRHELYYQTVGFQRQVGVNTNANRINYNLAPTYIWSLISFITSTGFQTDQISDANPDWLNRFLMRLTECELAIKFHTAATDANAAAQLTTLLGSTISQNQATRLQTALTQAWAYTPGQGTRSATGVEIQADAERYRTLADDLQNGLVAIFPLEKEPNITPVRVILGDFLGFPGLLDGTQSGIQVEIFSKEKLDVPGATLEACAASSEDWWSSVSSSTRNESTVEADLPVAAAATTPMAWHYSMTDFLTWANNITWSSEWQKYGLTTTDVLMPPTRPVTRLIT